MSEPSSSRPSLEGLAERPARYEGPLEQGMILTCPDNDGELGFRRVRLICRDPDDLADWIYDEQPSRMRPRPTGTLGRCPEINLRIVFRPE